MELAVLGLRSWLKVTSSLNLTMAIVQKQMIGQFVTNQGLRFHSGFGIVYVPHDKLRRSFASISPAEAGTLSLRDYHSLLGLLQSLIFVVGLRRSATFGLWEPLTGAADLGARSGQTETEPCWDCPPRGSWRRGGDGRGCA